MMLHDECVFLVPLAPLVRVAFAQQALLVPGEPAGEQNEIKDSLIIMTSLILIIPTNMDFDPGSSHEAPGAQNIAGEYQEHATGIIDHHSSINPGEEE